MSSKSNRETASFGNIGSLVVVPAPPAVALVNNTAIQVSGRAYLQQGVYIFRADVAFNPDGDNTTEVQDLQLNLLLEGGQINTATLMLNPVGSVIQGGSYAFDFVGVVYSNGATNNEFIVELNWIGAGTPPTATAQLTATKLI